MLPISLLQSQLAHNKKRINELQSFVKEYLFDIKSTNEHIKSLEGDAHAQDYVSHLMYEKLQYVKMLQKTRKQLKQLAILQKALKEQVFQHIIRNRIVKYEKIANRTTEFIGV